jgi:hypothetical protein
MSVEDEIKIAELKLKQLEIQQKEHELTAKTRFDLTRAAVLVTVIGGMSAVLFQGVGALTSWNEKKKAEVTAKSDFDFKGLELFIKEQGNLITCDQDESNRNLRLFQSLFSETVTRGFNEIVAYRSQKCVTQSANSATDRAKSASKSEAQVNAAADAARYAAVAQQAPLLSAGIEPGQARYRVFIHINSDTDRTAAATLQAALIKKGYSAPGIETVSTAPNRYQVRFYYKQQEPDAKTLALLAESVLGLGPSSIEIPPALERTFKSLPQGTLEFWFPRRT